ncbi:vancomycin high temperature exclusion protein [Pontibacter sp. HSC-36F09]|uniref:SanA/YdcF family protein n=1 Tax=Pontibacter sp. HSC-36F09 TaxID=2910966 RepID=UPI0020A03128|nr:ElyC/SanA/YdcF family protein [Pontibacter sp. HSC-36F09]MCP2043033.1 SanA protein [Pontibacter sp. HSC-36F09]
MKFVFRRKYLLVVPLACFVIAMACVFALTLVKRQSNQYTFRQTEHVPSCYTGIIFGAGIRNGKPSKYLQDRLDAGIRLYEAGIVQRLLLSGDNSSHNYDELKVMRDYCLKKNVRVDDIFLDFAGFDTYSTLYRAKEVFKVDRAVLVSQNYHLNRAIYIGRSLGLDSYGYIADKGHYAGYRRNYLREVLAMVNAFMEVNLNRKPKFLGEPVDIKGASNALLHY